MLAARWRESQRTSVGPTTGRWSAASPLRMPEVAIKCHQKGQFHCCASRHSNNAGGILGGISSGQDIIANLALKPTSSLHIPGRSVDVHGNPVEVITKGRHDPCVGIRATPIAEAMLALVLMDHLLRQRAQNGAVNHSVPVIPARVK